MALKAASETIPVTVVEQASTLPGRPGKWQMLTTLSDQVARSIVGKRHDRCQARCKHKLHGTSDYAGLAKHVTAHTLRHSAATWLRQETGDARLVAAYLGHADLSTVSRYAHVAPEELHPAAEAIAARSARAEPESTPERAASLAAAGQSEAGRADRGDARAPAPSGSRETA